MASQFPVYYLEHVCRPAHRTLKRAELMGWLQFFIWWLVDVGCLLLEAQCHHVVQDYLNSNKIKSNSGFCTNQKFWMYYVDQDDVHDMMPNWLVTQTWNLFSQLLPEWANAFETRASKWRCGAPVTQPPTCRPWWHNVWKRYVTTLNI